MEVNAYTVRAECRDFIVETVVRYNKHLLRGVHVES
jgi:hypothetical protein